MTGAALLSVARVTTSDRPAGPSADQHRLAGRFRYRVEKRVQIGARNGRSHEALQLFPVDNQLDFFGQISRNVAKPSFEDRHNVLVCRCKPFREPPRESSR